MPSDSAHQLRDIHLPDPIGWWPPALGWWLLAGLLIVLAVTVWLVRRYLRRRALPRAARAELEQLRLGYAGDADAQALLAGVSTWLRRVALQYFPRAEVAGLTGEAWLIRLDATLGGDDFRNGPGRVLHSGPYQTQPEVDAEALLTLCNRWLVAVHKTGGGR